MLIVKYEKRGYQLFLPVSNLILVFITQKKKKKLVTSSIKRLFFIKILFYAHITRPSSC